MLLRPGEGVPHATSQPSRAFVRSIAALLGREHLARRGLRVAARRIEPARERPVAAEHEALDAGDVGDRSQRRRVGDERGVEVVGTEGSWRGGWRPAGALLKTAAPGHRPDRRCTSRCRTRSSGCGRRAGGWRCSGSARRSSRGRRGLGGRYAAAVERSRTRRSGSRRGRSARCARPPRASGWAGTARRRACRSSSCWQFAHEPWKKIWLSRRASTDSK